MPMQSAEVRAVYDDIMAVRKTDWINNFWKALAHDPATLRRTWESIKQIMAPGALDAAHQRDDLLGGERVQSVPLLHCIPYRQRAQSRHERRHVRRTDGRSGDGERNQPACRAATRWRSTSASKRSISRRK